MAGGERTEYPAETDTLPLGTESPAQPIDRPGRYDTPIVKQEGWSSELPIAGPAYGDHAIGGGYQILDPEMQQLIGGAVYSEGILWSSWNDYPKVKAEGREYAQIGDRLYSRHAVDRMQPSGLGAPAGADGPGRNVTPNMVEEVIGGGTKTTTIANGIPRAIYTSGNVSVVAEDNGRTVVTILRNSSP